MQACIKEFTQPEHCASAQLVLHVCPCCSAVKPSLHSVAVQPLNLCNLYLRGRMAQASQQTPLRIHVVAKSTRGQPGSLSIHLLLGYPIICAWVKPKAGGDVSRRSQGKRMGHGDSITLNYEHISSQNLLQCIQLNTHLPMRHCNPNHANGFDQQCCKFWATHQDQSSPGLPAEMESKVGLGWCLHPKYHHAHNTNTGSYCAVDQGMSACTYGTGDRTPCRQKQLATAVKCHTLQP